MSILIKTEDLKKNYKQGDLSIDIIRGISLEIEEGEFVSIMGQSGSGKSTLLYLMTGIEKPTDGKVYMNGYDLTAITEDEITELRRNFFSMVWQFDNLITNLSIYENITLPLLLAKKPIDQAYVANLMAYMGISHIINKRPYEVSGGEQQRASIARALMGDPKIIFLDEPTGSLDTNSGQLVMELLQDINETRGITVVQVTHSPKHAAYGKRIIRVADGKIIDD